MNIWRSDWDSIVVSRELKYNDTPLVEAEAYILNSENIMSLNLVTRERLVCNHWCTRDFLTCCACKGVTPEENPCLICTGGDRKAGDMVSNDRTSLTCWTFSKS